MTTRTEQETRRGAPVRGAVPTTGAKTGQRRPEPPHPAKPVPQPRPDAARRRPRADDEPAPRAARPAPSRGETGARASRGAAGVRDRATRVETDERAAGTGVRGSRTVTEPRRARPGVRKPRPEAGRPEQARPRRPAAGRPARRQRAPFVLLVVGLLCGGLVTLLLLNTVLAQDSMTASNLVDEISTARQQNEDLQRKIEEEKLPGRVAERAEDLDMRRDWDSVNNYDGSASSQAGPAR
ncbi:hypothetical protein [Nonomuraea sp. C10]|uniref:hypothetical protein n=1 Tax=Nonomuraea sp. C10 TaxID=2600577 RepID=UPI0011CD6B4E|nr:hypothetical protein [Nonomuraea sp. C10]TXK41880.1 hypothetical protein FR742_22005 [Nonomuraea sp. C10]